MPLARIDCVAGKPPGYKETLGDIVYRVMVETLGAPVDDRFQIITEHPRADFQIAPSYLGIAHRDDPVFIQLTLNAGRTTAQKRAFYGRVADEIHQRLGVRREDVIINLVEVHKENWSFGNGLAPYAD